MIKDVLSTVRSLQRVENKELVGIVSRITDEILKAPMLFRVMLESYYSDDGRENRSRKIQVIKILREATSLGLKEAKEHVETLDFGGPIALMDEVSYEVAHKAVEELNNFGLKAKVERR
jgi:ribosomal protein L7/L12